MYHYIFEDYKDYKDKIVINYEHDKNITKNVFKIYDLTCTTCYLMDMQKHMIL